MAKIFISGSSDGLGLLAAQSLIRQGHQVVAHARNEQRAHETAKRLPGAEKILIADLSSLDETQRLAAEVNAVGTMDAVIHNAGLYQVSGKSADGLPLLFAVNTLAPYVLSCLVEPPQRLVYLSSDMHLYADPTLKNLSAIGITGSVTYSDTKFHDVILTMALADRWKNVFCNALNPGWVPTKMGGAGAPDSLEKGYETQVWLATSNDPEACVSGRYFHHQKQVRFLAEAKDKKIQEKLLGLCEKLSGLRLPEDQ